MRQTIILRYLLEFKLISNDSINKFEEKQKTKNKRL